MHLKRARTYGTPQAVAACTQSYKQASVAFNKVKDAEVRKVFKNSMDEEAAKGLPELSKKAHTTLYGRQTSGRRKIRYFDGKCARRGMVSCHITVVSPSDTA